MAPNFGSGNQKSKDFGAHSPLKQSIDSHPLGDVDDDAKRSTSAVAQTEYDTLLQAMSHCCIGLH